MEPVMMNLADRMQRAVKLTTRTAVFLRADFEAFGRPSQISVALKALQQRGVLARIGTGVYAKTRISSVTGKPVPAGSLETLGLEALQKLGVPVNPSRATLEYNSGRTTQLPGKLVVNTGNRQISRKIRIGDRQLGYENNLRGPAATA
jgi:hypothetical protein